MVENCEIIENGGSGIRIAEGGKPIVCGCRINRNAHHGVWADATASGRIENCDLQGNGLGAFGMHVGHQVVGVGNVE